MRKHKFFNENLSLAAITEKRKDLRIGLLSEHSRYEDIQKLIPDEKVVLDYGCGFGVFTSIIADRSKEVVGIDQSKHEISIEKKYSRHKKSKSFC